MANPSPATNTHPDSSIVDIKAWTEETLESIRKLRLTSSPEAVCRGVSLSIPLDPAIPTSATTGQNNGREKGSLRREADGEVQLREPKRRDSLKRREALLKGKEGSRRRQKWENGNELS
jgi:hypothetical protein